MTDSLDLHKPQDGQRFDLAEQCARERAAGQCGNDGVPWSLSVRASGVAEEIINYLARHAVELVACRSGVVSEEDNEALDHEDVDVIAADLVDVMMGHDSGCLDPEDLDATNCAFHWIEDKLRELLQASFSQTEEDKSSMATAADSPSTLRDRITQYLSLGGLFNPESMDHRKVRDLLIECRDALPTPSPSKGASSLADARPELVGNAAAAVQLSALLERWQKVSKLHSPNRETLVSRMAVGMCADELERLLDSLAVPQSEPQVCGCILFGNHTVKLCESHWLALTPPFPRGAAAAPKPAPACEAPQRPKIICLCGSTRFIEQFAIQTWELELKGNIVLGCTLLPSWYCPVRDHFAESLGVKEQRDNHHLQKIDLADEVLVLNIGGYIGESTRSEIAYAESHGKPVRYLEALAASVPPPRS